jgi:hypothetical protein
VELPSRMVQSWEEEVVKNNVEALRSRLLLGSCVEFPGGRGGALGTAFLFDMLGAIGDFVVDFLDFECEVKFLGVLGVFFEKRVTPGFQIVAFFLPDSGNG